MNYKKEKKKRGRPKGKPKPTILMIRCNYDTKKAFKKYAADYPNYEEALRSLLARAGVLRESLVF
jgi:hypothetical protein